MQQANARWQVFAIGDLQRDWERSSPCEWQYLNMLRHPRIKCDPLATQHAQTRTELLVGKSARLGLVRDDADADFARYHLPGSSYCLDTTIIRDSNTAAVVGCAESCQLDMCCA